MYFTCTFRNRRKSEEALLYAKEKLEELVGKYTPAPVGMALTFRTIGVRDCVRLSFQADRFFSLTIAAEGYGTHHAVDNLVAKLKNSLRKKKEKFHDQKARRGQLTLLEDLGDEGEADEEPIDAEELIAYERARLSRGLAHF